MKQSLDGFSLDDSMGGGLFKDIEKLGQSIVGTATSPTGIMAAAASFGVPLPPQAAQMISSIANPQQQQQAIQAAQTALSQGGNPTQAIYQTVSAAAVPLSLIIAGVSFGLFFFYKNKESK